MPGPLPRTEGGSKYIFVIPDRHSKLTKSIPTVRMTATSIVSIFMELSVSNFRIPSTVLTDNGPQFSSKFFAALCKKLEDKTLVTTNYHLQDNGQVERFNAIIISRLRNYVAEHEKDWDKLMFP